MLTRQRSLVGLALAAAVALASPAAAQAPAAGPPPAAQTGAPPPGRAMPDVYAGKKKLLIVADVQSGFHHDSINHAMAVLERLGRESGAYVAFLRTDSQLITKAPLVGKGARYTGRPINAKNLNYFDAVFILGSGEGTLSAQQKADLLSFVREDGKGLIGGHASTIAFYDWPEYGQMIGGFMDSEFQIAPTALIVDRKFPGAETFPTTMADQFPVLKAPYAKGNFHTIVRLDPAKLTPEQRARRPDGDIPVVWAKTEGKGRVFVSNLGHLDERWDDPAVQKLYLEGIRWALGLTNPDVTPDH